MATKDDYIRYWESQGISLADLKPVVRSKKRKKNNVYCDRNLCIENEYNGVDCHECQEKRKDEVE